MSKHDPEIPSRWRDRRPARGIPLRTVAPNAVTALALCFGLSGIRFAIAAKWELAVLMVIVAGCLDGLDGRIARLLRGESRFGAELDSLSDVIAFGVSPAIIVYLWSLQTLPRYGWLFALAHALCCALRLARFNAQIDAVVKPHKQAGFLTGMPAPAGAGALCLPIYLWLATGIDLFRQIWLVAPWAALTASLMISTLPTYSWGSLRLRRGMRLGALVAIAMLGAALISAPWETLSLVTIAYLAAIPFGMRSYARIKRLRAARPSTAPMAASTPS